MDPTPEGTGGGGRFRANSHPSLRRYVVEYWALARDLAAMGGFTITPDRHGELICCPDEMEVVSSGGREKLPACFLIGLLDGPMRVEAPGVVRLMAARLEPWAVGRMTAIEPKSRSRGWSDAGGVFGRRLDLASDLVRRLDWPALVDLFDAMLMEVTGRWSHAPEDVELAERFIAPGHRRTTSVALARRISDRQVERRVRWLTRTSPKQLANLCRFQQARDAIWADPSIDLAGLAIDAGYSDQPHMTRQFRRYSGQTPARFARSSARAKRTVAGPDVAFVQEAGERGG